MPQISFDPRAITIDGRRTLLISGAVHYPRSTPDMWPAIFARSKAAGINCIETYVFWNLHERTRGVLDFSDRLDLSRFCRLAAEAGLHVILRIGPYVCAETNYGGLPPWLRELPGVKMRTFNKPFLDEMARFVHMLVDYVRPLLAPNGGPIVLAQLENEYNNISKYYGDEGRKYLDWVVELSRRVDLGVPLIMCAGSAPGALETINEFYGHRGIEKHHAEHPEQPKLWTEAYPGWYDTWGYPHHTRRDEDLAYAAARFFAGGGTGINYYMWHGGTNFGRESMYLQTTSYDFNAPLDEFGLETTKSNHLSRLHAILHEHGDLLLGEEAAKPQALGEKQVVYRYGKLAFLCNDDDAATAAVEHEGTRYELAPLSCVIVSGGGTVLMDTAKVAPATVVRRAMAAVDEVKLEWEWWAEPLPGDWPERLRSATTADQPIEQLSLTHDATDYCWYAARLRVAESEDRGALVFEGAADVLHVFLDGELKSTTRSPLMEDRPLDEGGFRQSFPLRVKPGEYELSVLCTALGLIKGDWSLGFKNMAEERKGIWAGVTWNGQALNGNWRMQPGLVGERYALWFSAGDLLRWKPAGSPGGKKPLRWWRTRFDRPSGDVPLTLDLAGMTKGMIYLNGRCAGRYWLALGEGKSFPWLTANRIGDARVGEPTQRYYHLPASWLAEHNELVLFEEVGGDIGAVRVCAWKELGVRS